MSEQRDGLGALVAKLEARHYDQAVWVRVNDVLAALAAHEGVEPSTEERAMAIAADSPSVAAYETLAERCNQLEQMIGEISMILRNDVTR